MAESTAPAKGTRPEGTTTQAQASRKVREMFTEIAPRYDALNHILSLDIDRIWRARVAKRLRRTLARPDAIVLDLCCGTGDLAFAMRKCGKARILGADFAHAMLVRARDKSAKGGSRPGARGLLPLPLIEADALHLPFADKSFDLVTTAFGFRNLANYEEGLREIKRVLKPGGTAAILEFAEPPDGLIGGLYRWYFCTVLPKIGGLISGDQLAYRYLPKSVARFFRPTELAELMGAVGFQRAEHEVWTLGIVALHRGIRG